MEWNCKIGTITQFQWIMMISIRLPHAPVFKYCFSYSCHLATDLLINNISRASWNAAWLGTRRKTPRKQRSTKETKSPNHADEDSVVADSENHRDGRDFSVARPVSTSIIWFVTISKSIIPENTLRDRMHVKGCWAWNGSRWWARNPLVTALGHVARHARCHKKIWGFYNISIM